MNRGRGILAALAICAIAALAPATASARTAFFTFDEEGESAAASIDLGSGSLGGPVSVGTEGPPFDVAITPDGSAAYVPGFEELVRIDVATDTEGTPIPTPGVEARALAISPDGQRIYTANSDGTVSVFDLSTGAELGSPIAAGTGLHGIAVTPDGTRAYVTDSSTNSVVAINLANGTVIESIPTGEQPWGVAVTPDGSTVYAANRLGESVTRIDTATNAATATIPAGPAEQIAISPDGSHAYLVGFKFGSSPSQSGVTPIDLATATAGATVLMEGFGEDIAILPDGSRAYVTNQDPQHGKQQLLPFDLATNALGSGLPTYEQPSAIAIVPNQPPHAAISGPEVALPGAELSFDGSASTDSDGTVARYDWDFGDGTTASNGGAVVDHAYAKPGTYQVTLTTTDNEGCSTALVFTGQTAYCNGSSVAQTTHEVTVAAQCKQVLGKATSFTPKIRPGNVVPGVRVRLAVGAPARLAVKAKLLWSDQGKQRRTTLRKLSVNVNRWRRVRFPIPAKLRAQLPLGKRVKVQLTIRATPRDGSGCSAATTHKTLNVRVVKVFPHAVQHRRPR